MASKDPRLRTVSIKAGVLKRCSKEKTSYEKEVRDQEAKVEKMKQEGKDEYDIKKQVEVLDESRMMIPDCQRRINAAYIDLKNCLEAETNPEVIESEVYKEAQSLLEANKPSS
ncbi:Tubulin-specific chaperone A [Holothuria leucospilota]|uniref:Tubulin-specific chaperone A n=1 Tax=Holothuria leucospilota TaxID=206669 RepID=A0A9Q1H1U2_HOLLE|nr:Tubulin-specific chaperone A [Holothuria leucospilota]